MTTPPPSTTIAEVFYNPRSSNPRSFSPVVLDPENSLNPSYLALSQSDLSSCDSDPKSLEVDFAPISEPLACDYIHDYHDDQVSFVTNLFDGSAENGFNLDALELGSGDSEVNLELGLGLGLDVGAASSRQPAEERRHFEGLRVASVDSESDSEDEFLGDVNQVDVGFGGVSDFDRPPFCWDYLGFNNRRRERETFELGRGYNNSQSHEREIELSDIVADEDDEDDDHGGNFFFGRCHDGFDDDFETPIQLDADDGHREAGEELILFETHHDRVEQEVMIESDSDEGEELGVEEAIRDLQWEILLAVNNFNEEVHDMGLNVDMYETILSEVEDRMYDWKGSPPAAQSVIENLPIVRVHRESLEENNAICSICKDEVSAEETVRQLPCLHYYHGDCIVPWLKIRNTCPLCRHELPTDDLDYEYRRREGALQSADGEISLNSQTEYDFHVFL